MRKATIKITGISDYRQSRYHATEKLNKESKEKSAYTKHFQSGVLVFSNPVVCDPSGNPIHKDDRGSGRRQAGASHGRLPRRQSTAGNGAA